jgi:hypothetical protein
MMNTDCIRNVPGYAYNGHPYWVVREVDGEYWFYGAYDTLARAREVAAMVDGLAVEAF